MPNPINISVQNVDELLNPGLFDAGAVIELQSSASQLTGFTALSGTGSTPTLPLASGDGDYTGYDPNGTFTTWYRLRYRNAASTRFSVDWAGDALWYTRPGHEPFQTGNDTTGTGVYAALANIKLRLSITDDADDARLTRFCNWTNAWIENKTGRILAPYPLTAQLYDGFDALENGRLLMVPDGIRAISLLRVAITTGNTFNVIPATDYFLNPTGPPRAPGWPATELWMTDIPSSGNAIPFFPRGYRNIEITGLGGWQAPPDEIVAIAEKMVVLAWKARAAGQGDEIGPVGLDQFARSVLDGRDWHTLMSYAQKQVVII